MGNVRDIRIMRNNSESAMFSMSCLLESRSDLLHLRTPLGWKRIQPKISQIKTGCSLFPALRNQEGATSWCSARLSKRIMMEFTIVSNEIQYIVTRNSKIGWTEEKCIAMDKLSLEDHSYRLSYEEYERYQKNGISHWTNRARMHRCDFDQTSELHSQSRTVSTENQEKNVQNRFLFNNIKDGTLLPQVIPGGTGTRPKAGGAHEFNSFFEKVCCSRFRLQLMPICCKRRKV